MQRSAISAIVWCVLAAGLAFGAPARPLFVDDLPAKAPLPAFTMTLNDTVWLGKYSTTQRLFVFEADGTLSYRTPASKAKPFKNRGTWRVVGNTVHFEHWVNPQVKLIEFRGTFRDANTIVGEQTMLQTGQKSTVVMQRTTLDGK